MKRFFLPVLLMLSLGSCALLAPPVAPAPPVTDPGSAAVSLTPAEGYKIARFDAGKLDAPTVKLTLSGTGLAVNDASCKATGGKLVCDIGTVKAGAGYVLPARGVVKVEADYTRPGDPTVYKLATD